MVITTRKAPENIGLFRGEATMVRLGPKECSKFARFNTCKSPMNGFFFISLKVKIIS